jgi:hypothetical protein
MHYSGVVGAEMDMATISKSFLVRTIPLVPLLFNEMGTTLIKN